MIDRSGHDKKQGANPRQPRQATLGKEGNTVRWIRFSQQGRRAYGILEDDRLREVAGDPFQGWEATAKSHALADVKIEVPVLPPTFYCVGLNYAQHVLEAASKLGIKAELPTQPDVGYRAVNALVAHEDAVVIPDGAQKVQYEGELAVVIGKRARHLPEADALSCVLGYTIGNDVSERTWQKADRSLWRSKNADTFKPMGPWIETDVDLDKMETVIRVNGTETGRFHTNDMIFGVVPFLVELSKYFTLSPGDVIWMGTDGASPNLKAGDVVEIDITGIGTLRNRFVAEKI
jgi:2-keto-4-pentenoate hydratase/2-oxohepta-3-ene-1,7-dioic acid hydratase in catechol pathway